MDAKNRSNDIEQSSKQLFDVLIIGGGITGAGVALDAAARDLKVGLLEMQDFSEGTSSRSTKLIHGGLRYLKQLQFGVVAKTGREREILFKNAPYLIRKIKMLLPVYSRGSLGWHSTKLALFIYDFLAKVDRKERFVTYSKKQTIVREPRIKSYGLIGSFSYTEYQTDDSRLVIEVLKTAFNKGAKVFNYLKVIKIEKQKKGNFTVTVRDQLDQTEFIFNSKSLVNATGPWVDDLVLKENLGGIESKIIHSKGVHIVFDRKDLLINGPIYFDTLDGRMIFAIPRDGKVYVGTTDTIYEESSLRNPIINEGDIKYLIQAVNKQFPDQNIKALMITGSWSGIRPLIRGKTTDTKELSRKDEIFISTTGMITIAGGKLTGYRAMAEKVMKIILKKRQPIVKFESVTKSLKLRGTDIQTKTLERMKKKFSIYDEELVEVLYRKYGKRSSAILENSKGYSSIVVSELAYCMKNELCVKLIDFFVRRSGMFHFQPERIIEELPDVLSFLKKEVNWGDLRIEKEKQEILSLIDSRKRFFY